MKTHEKKRTSEIDKAQDSVKRKSIMINAMVFSILSFIAVLLITQIA